MVRRRKNLSEEDKLLWKRVTSTIEPMHEHVGMAAASYKKPDELAKKFSKLLATPKKVQPNTAKTLMPSIQARVPQRPLVSQSLDHKTRKKIVKGRMPIEARIDLHGMTQNKAISKLSDFLHRAQANDCRLVLVITGKGEMGNGILRRQVPNWLTSGELLNIVGGFQEAHISHGGSGALYVRIRRL